MGVVLGRDCNLKRDAHVLLLGCDGRVLMRRNLLHHPYDVDIIEVVWFVPVENLDLQARV